MASVVPESREILCLFDVDGTITPARSVRQQIHVTISWQSVDPEGQSRVD